MRIKSRKCFSLFLCIIVLFSSLILPVSAYSLKGWYIDDTVFFIPYVGFSAAAQQCFATAIVKMNDAAGQNLMTISSSHSDTTGYPDYDTNSYICFIDIGEDYVAQCATHAPSGYVLGADINMNAYYSWANGAAADKYDYCSVFMHEIGHAAGLGHSDMPTAVMYSYVDTNTTKRNYTDDDILGLTAIY